MLDKNSIKSIVDYKEGELHVPMWGGSVRLRSPNLKETDYLAKLLRKSFDSDGTKVIPIKGEESEESYRKYKLFAVGFSLCDDNGERLFSDDEIESILGKKSPESIHYIFEKINEVLEKKSSQKSEN